MKLWRHDPPQARPEADGRQLPEASNDTRPETDWPVAIPTTARRLAKAYPNMFPENASAAAFVSWRQFHGETGEVLQEALYDDYSTMCEIAGFKPLPLKRFGRELEMAGCQRKQEDYRKNGKGSRPKVITVPSVPTPANRVPSRVIHLAKAA